MSGVPRSYGYGFTRADHVLEKREKTLEQHTNRHEHECPVCGGTWTATELRAHSPVRTTVRNVIKVSLP